MVQIDKKKHKIQTALIIGLGSIGMRHLGVITELFPNIKIIALRHNPESCNEMISGVSLSVSNLQDAISEKPDIAIIANPASMHLSIAIELAMAGIHLLIEKPLSKDSHGVEDLLNLCSSKNVKIMTGFNLRFLPCLAFLKKQVEQKKIGKILSIQAEVGQNLKQWRPGSEYSKGVSARKDLGGGVLLELCHELDYLMWIFGKVNWVIGSLSQQSNLNIDVEDTANILMEMRAEAFNNNGIDAVLKIDFTRHDLSRNCTIIGEKGTLKCDLIEGKVFFYCGIKGQWEKIFSDKKERNYSFQLQLQSFLTSVEEDHECEITGEDGLLALQLIDAIRDSNIKNQKIYIP